MLHAPPIRPRFQVELPHPPEAVLTRLVAPLETEGRRIEGLVAGRHVEWMIPQATRHFWSPRLSLEVVDGIEGDDGCRLSGLFGPRPSVWTLFALGYGSIAFVAVTAAFFGASQYWIDQPPWALWGIPVSGAAALVLYGASLFGQRLASEEMDLLRDLLVESLRHDDGGGGGEGTGDAAESSTEPPTEPPGTP